jgi:hypothetical protein
VPPVAPVFGLQQRPAPVDRISWVATLPSADLVILTPPDARGSLRRPPVSSPDSRSTAQIGSTDSSTRIAATTLTTGAWLGRNRLSKIQRQRLQPRCGRERGDHDLVERQGEGQHAAATRAERSRGNVTNRKV